MIEERYDLLEDACGAGVFSSSTGARLSLEDARHAEDDVEVGLARKAEFVGGGVKGFDVAGDDLAIVAAALLGGAFNLKRKFDVAAEQMVLEHAAEVHLEGVETGGKAQLQIEKAVVDALEGEE